MLYMYESMDVCFCLHVLHVDLVLSVTTSRQLNLLTLVILFLYHFSLSVKCLYNFGTAMIFGRDIDGVQWVKPNDFGDSQTLNSVAPVGQSYHTAS